MTVIRNADLQISNDRFGLKLDSTYHAYYAYHLLVIRVIRGVFYWPLSRNHGVNDESCNAWG